MSDKYPTINGHYPACNYSQNAIGSPGCICVTVNYNDIERREAELLASQSRVARLEAALRHEIANCVNCSGVGKYSNAPGGQVETYVCMRCKPARDALTNDAGEGA